MNINNSPPAGANVVASNKVSTRSVEKTAKEADTEVRTNESVDANKQAAKSQEVKAQEKALASKELKQERLAQESEQEFQEKVETAVETIRGFIQENQRDLDFDVARESNRVIITVKDKVSEEVIRQIPPEDALELAERIERGEDIASSGILLQGQV